MSILSNHFPEVLDELNADPERPAAWSAQPTADEITAMGEAAGELLTQAPARTRKPRPKPSRSIRVLGTSHGLHELPAGSVVEIDMTTVGPRVGARTESCRYFVTRLASDFGRAFQATREDTGDAYAVLLDGRQSSCECKGFLRHGHCKHVAGLTALVQAGKL